MTTHRTPIVWPADWNDPARLDIVRNTLVNCLILNDKQRSGKLGAKAAQLGLTVLDAKNLPKDVVQVAGEWPGVRTARGGSANAGPTGAPWLDTNGWRVRLARAEGKAAWVRAETPKRLLGASDQLVAVADAAAHGGQFLLKPDRATWPVVSKALGFFAKHAAWSELKAKAVLGICSDFAGPHEFTAHELLNLTARLNQPYRILKGDGDLTGLTTIVYPDGAPPPELRKKLTAFAEAGGLLVATSPWGKVQGEQLPRMTVAPLGKGRIAVTADDAPDPYMLAADTQVLMSHRQDLLLMWNAGSFGTYLTVGESGGLLLHLINYTGRPGNDPVTVSVKAACKTVRMWTWDQEPRDLKFASIRDTVEIPLPPIAVYAALELI